jgi:hypothetical protein
MMVTTEHITAKILDAHHTLGGIDRFYGQTDWGALPPDAVQASDHSTCNRDRARHPRRALTM